MKLLIDGRPLLENQRCGVGTYALEMTRALAGHGKNKITVWGSGLKSDWPRELPQKGLKTALTRWPNKLVNAGFTLFGQPRIENYANTTPDLVYLPNLNFMATDRPYAVTVHDLSFIHFPEFFPLKGRIWHRAINPERLIKNAAKVIAVSNHTKKDVRELFNLPAERISVASPGVGAEYRPDEKAAAAVREKYDLTTDYFLFVGAIEPRKNLEGLIAAFERVPGDAHLVIAGGKGWLNRSVFSRADASPKAGRIHFLGYVSTPNKVGLYSGALALVYPSFYEGFGMPPVEAMACGTPVIASQVSSLPEVIGDAGLLVNPHDVDSIAAAMSALAKDRAARAELGRRGLERAKEFTWKISSEKLVAALTK